MKAEDHRILREFANCVRELEPRARARVSRSRARGDAELDPDFHLCVVVPQVAPELRRRIRDWAWESGFARGCVLATVSPSEEECENGASRPGGL